MKLTQFPRIVTEIRRHTDTPVRIMPIAEYTEWIYDKHKSVGADPQCQTSTLAYTCWEDLVKCECWPCQLYQHTCDLSKMAASHITFMQEWVENLPKNMVLKTAMHEVAHAVGPATDEHNQAWQQRAIKLGGVPVAHAPEFDSYNPFGTNSLVDKFSVGSLTRINFPDDFLTAPK